MSEELARKIFDLEIENFRLIRERDEARAAIANANNSLFGSQGFFLSKDGGEPNLYHLAGAIEAIKKLAHQYRQERDEARAERDTYKIAYENVYANQEGMILTATEAEARGFERGVREAAAVLDRDGWSSPRDAILALLEPKLSDLPHSEGISEPAHKPSLRQSENLQSGLSLSPEDKPE
jgi:hypothetical protein